MSAQAMTEEVRRSAEREAERRLAEVEIRAEKILDASHRRAARLDQDIRDMRALRMRLGQALRSAAETHLSILETLESDPEPDAIGEHRTEGSVAYLAAKPSVPTTGPAEAAPSPSPEDIAPDPEAFD